MATSMSTPRYFEYVVIGCGGIGSAAVYWLSKTVGGKNVLGLEQFKLGHDHGGSQDHSRIIRSLYHDERYTRMVRDTFTAFEEVERESGLQLVYKCGGLELAAANTPQADMLDRFGEAMDKYNISYERLNGDQIRQRFPQFSKKQDIVGLYQKNSGLVDAAMANATHTQLARKHGATILENCKVLKIEKDRDGIHALVHTSQGVFRCRRVIVTAGAWINHVLGSVGVRIPLTVTQEQVTYLATPHIKDFTKDNFPSWIYVDKSNNFYGLPIHGNTGSKIGIDAAGPSVTPETRTYKPDPIREKRCVDFLESFLPKAVGPILYTKTCLYAMTPDRHFVIDSLVEKGFPQVIICNGAGHAYKWSCLLGKILTQMAVDGKSQYPIADFKLDREALTNPDFIPTLTIQKTLEKSRL
ncbi:monomeric sarcosine oxidase-like [Glandiceps talaboti]